MHAHNNNNNNNKNNVKNQKTNDRWPKLFSLNPATITACSDLSTKTAKMLKYAKEGTIHFNYLCK